MAFKNNSKFELEMHNKNMKDKMGNISKIAAIIKKLTQFILSTYITRN